MNHEPAPGVPGLRSLSPERSGYEFFVAGSCLKPNSQLWTDAQRERGIFVRMVFLTASEEEAALSEGEGRGRHSGITQFRMALHAVADVIDADDGTKGPAAWKPISTLEKSAYWEELGNKGRQLAGAAYNLANAADEEARKAMKDSFRLFL